MPPLIDELTNEEKKAVNELFNLLSDRKDIRQVKDALKRKPRNHHRRRNDNEKYTIPYSYYNRRRTDR